MEWSARNRRLRASGYPELTVDAIKPPSGVSDEQAGHRLELWKVLEDGFLNNHASASPNAHRTVYDNALRMIHSEAAAAFDLSKEPAKVREQYGKGVFGQGCLLARRLIEMGVPFVEVSLSTSMTGGFGWDTHANNFESVKALSTELDAGWASLHVGPVGPRPVGTDDDCVDGRVWSHAADQWPGRARSFPKSVVVRAGGWRHRRRTGVRTHQQRRDDH